MLAGWCFLSAPRYARFDILSRMKISAALLLLLPAALPAQDTSQHPSQNLAPTGAWTVEEANRYMIRPNITYGTQNNFETKLDVYQRRDQTTPQPTLIFIHGGGWVGGSKDSSMFSFLPYLEM